MTTNTFKTTAPTLSDATLARIRAAAHRFVLAGGSPFALDTDQNLPEHIGNVRELINPKAAPENQPWLDLIHDLDFEAHERLYDAVLTSLGEQTDAAFLFGVFVGLEFAGLTVGLLATIPTIPTPRRSARGGK